MNTTDAVPLRRCVLTLLLAAATLAPRATLAQPAPSPAAADVEPQPAPVISAVAAVEIVVADLDASTRFYADVLGFEPGSPEEIAGDDAERLRGLFGVRARSAVLRLGEERIRLTQYLAPEGQPIPAGSRSNDLWFQHIAIVVSDMDRAYAHLRRHKVRHASSGPQTLPSWNQNAAGISAFYFKDPDGHVLEVIHFPPGKGDPRWQAPTDRLFLGIDHTAIVVADTERSIAFYRDVLGMTVVGGSENFGTEQEHLNNVFGARLRITTLRAVRGPGVELLEYLAPSDGRDYPAQTRTCDSIAWQTCLMTADIGEVEGRLRRGRSRWVSPGVIQSPLGAGLLVRDPDGHLVLITETVPPMEAGE